MVTGPKLRVQARSLLRALTRTLWESAGAPLAHRSAVGSRGRRSGPLAFHATGRPTDERLRNDFEALCAEWVATRSGELWDAIAALPRNHPESLRAQVLVELKRGRLESLRTCQRGLVHELLCAQDDPDPVIASLAPRAIASVDGDGVLTELLEEIESGDRRLAWLAGAALARMTRCWDLQLIASAWSRTRDPWLEGIVLGSQVMPRSSRQLRLEVLLLRGDFNALGRLRIMDLPLLHSAAMADRDPRLRETAKRALSAQSSTGGREFVCQLAMQGDVIAISASVAGGYLPRRPREAAYFLLLTGQEARFDEFDPKRALLREFYSTAGADTRRTIAEKVRTLSWRDMLPAVMQRDYLREPRAWSAADADLIVDTHFSERHWGRLWQLVFELTPLASSRVVVRLRKLGWKPDDETECAIFEALADLVAEAGGLKECAATGDCSAQVDLASLLRQPLAEASPAQHQAVRASRSDGAAHDASHAVALEYLDLAMGHMFRHAIMVEEPDRTSYGPFDITIE